MKRQARGGRAMRGGGADLVADLAAVFAGFNKLVTVEFPAHDVRQA